MKEQFLDMIDSQYTKDLVSIYLNPTPTEMQKYIPMGARGYIDISGDVYIEGYESEGAKLSQIIHEYLLNILKLSDKIKPSIKKRLQILVSEGFHYDEMLENCLSLGICIVRKSMSEVFTVAESYDKDSIKDDVDIQDDIMLLFMKAKKRNSKLKFTF